MSDHPHHQPPGWAAPNPGQFASNQYGAQPGPGQPDGGHSSWQPPEEPGRGKRRTLILGLVAGFALLAIVGAGLWLVLGGDSSPDTAAADSDEAEAEAEASDDAGTAGETAADAAVEGYLTALAAGDFDEAFSYVQEDPRSGLLTDELLNESLELAPISNIDVEPLDADPEDYSDYVSYTYTVGDQDFSGELHVVHSLTDDQWIIGGTAVTTQLSALDPGSLDFSVNGETVPSQGGDVLYGLAYHLDVEHENFMLSSTDDDGVLITDDNWFSFSTQDIVLTEEAEEQWRAAILEEAEACLESTTYEAGCGLDMPEEISGDQVIDGTIERVASTSTQQTLQNLTPRMDYSNPNLVTAEEHISGLEVFYDCSGPQGEGQCELLTGDARQFDSPLVDMAAEELEVVWE